MSKFGLLKPEPTEGGGLCRCPKMVGCNGPIKTCSSRFPSWLRRVRILILHPPANGNTTGCNIGPITTSNRRKRATIPGLTITSRGRSVCRPLDITTRPGHLGKPAPEAGEGRSVPEHRSPGGSLPCPGLTMLCPGRVRGRLEPTQRSSYRGWPPISSHRPTAEPLRRSDALSGHRQSVGSSHLKAMPLGRGGERWARGPASHTGHRSSTTCPISLNLVQTSVWLKPQRTDGVSVKASEKRQSIILRLRGVDIS